MSRTNNTFQLQKFNLDWIKDDSIVMLLGGRRTGKTTIIKDIMYHKRHLPAAVVMSGTEECNDEFNGIVPDSYIFDGWHPEIAAKILKRQAKLRKVLRARGVPESSLSKLMGMIVTMEDLGYDSKSWAKSREIKSMFMNGRHFKLLCIIPMQYAVDIPPNLRDQVDYVFILRQNKIKRRMGLWEHWAGIFPNPDIFGQVLNQTTNNYECLVIDNTKTETHDLQDSVYFFKADLHKQPFRVGNERYWNSHLKKYNPKYNDDSEDDAPVSSKKPVIKVNKMY